MTDKEKIRVEIERLISIRDEKTFLGIEKISALKEVLSFIDSMQEEPVSEELEEAAFDYAEACKYEGGEKLLCVEHFKAGAKWQFERVKEALLSEVLPCFMHGGEADEVVAKLDEVLNQKK